MTATQNPSLPSPPFYTIPNINNLRDAALACNHLSTPTGKIRPGVLFRSAEVSHLDAGGWKAVWEIGVGHVFDLRSAPEVEKGWRGITGEGKSGEEGENEEKVLGVGDVRKGWEEGMRRAGVRRTWCPVFPEADYSPERLAERYMKYMDESESGFIQAYHDILTHAGPAFRTILQYLAALPLPHHASPPSPPPSVPLGALIHCTAGKDRTGIFFGILLSFLDVPKENIAAEYNLTEQGLSHVREQVVSRLMQASGFKQYALRNMAAQDPSLSISEQDLKDAHVPGGVPGKVVIRGKEVDIPESVLEKGRGAALRMIGARRESMLGVLEMVEREWGGAEGYLRKVCGLGTEELKGLKKGLVVGV
ncbi:hypothetical protein K458DRAFT_434355 [Lentithecium fluviatile CBS 122367]|uniref:Tyrosine specific protein phosphatases domain-containing protein n=1 Tax=Lentithecium fluviatile CBS 122367 TaxID=1168545 RepID=A0A6G1IQK4_9PLEO|nr:hypothetical protein K458DRAFT_434355 [Lentithecium fluviatile CBS 122367]